MDENEMKQCACEKERWPTCQRHACNVLSVRGTIRREGSSFPLRETGAVLPSFHGPLLASIWVWPGVGPTKPIPSDRTLQFSNGVWLSLLCAGPTEFYPTPCFSAPKKKNPHVHSVLSMKFPKSISESVCLLEKS